MIEIPYNIVIIRNIAQELKIRLWQQFIIRIGEMR